MSVLSFFILLFLISMSQIDAVIVGSNTVVSRQATNTVLPYNDTNNQLLGFAAFAQGFTLARSDTNGLFSDFFPASGAIDLRSGSLRLQYDLVLDQSASFLSTGSLIAAGSGALYLPVRNTSLSFPSRTNLLQFITAQTQTTAPTRVDWSFDSAYTVNFPAASVQTLQIYNFNGSTLTAAASLNPVGRTLTDAQWHPSLYYIAEAHAVGGGNDLQTYLFTPPSTLTLAGGLDLAAAAQSLAFRPNGLHLAYAATTNLNIASFDTGTGALATVATLSTTNSSANRAMSWLDNTFLVLGFGVTSQLRMYSFNGSNTVTQVATFVTGSAVTTVAAARFGGYFAAGLSAGTNRIRMFQFNGVSTITEITSAGIPDTLTVNSIDWSPTGSTIVVGLASGTATQLRTYDFNPNAGTLTLTGQVSLLSPSAVSGVAFAPNGQYIATTDNNASGTAAFFRAVSIYQLLTRSQPFLFYKMKMVMNSNLIMNTDTVFQGLCEIEGNDNVLTFSAGNYLSIGSTSTLLLKNMTINGIYDQLIQCADNSAVLQLQNVTWVQSSTTTFSSGALQINNDVLFTGTSPFIYASSAPCTINANATWAFDSGMTFSYAPSSAANNLLVMADQTATLYFNNTNLFASAVGMQLTKGKFIINGPCLVNSNAGNAAQGISFGDGVSAANNCTVKILPESGFILNSGFLIHNNV